MKKVRVRTDTHLHTVTLTGAAAEMFITKVSVANVKFSTGPEGQNVIIMKDDLSFNINPEIRIMLFKGYYVIIDKE
jgi:hypothetical protein